MDDFEANQQKVYIFDTTLRDAEQTPGAALGIEEKLQIAKHLARLNVDIIEAGFPISSPGDFDAVKRIANEVEGPEICALSRVVERISLQRGRRLKTHHAPVSILLLEHHRFTWDVLHAQRLLTHCGWQPKQSHTQKVYVKITRMPMSSSHPWTQDGRSYLSFMKSSKLLSLQVQPSSISLKPLDGQYQLSLVN